MSRRGRSTDGVGSLFEDESEPTPSQSSDGDPYWFARTLSYMLFGGRSAIQGGRFPRAEVEAQLVKTWRHWCRFVNVDCPAEPSTELLIRFESAFMFHWHYERNWKAADVPDRAALAAVRELRQRGVLT